MYYLYFNNNQFGPYTDDQIRGMINQGSVPNSALIFDSKGSKNWVSLQNFPHLLNPPPKKIQNIVIDPNQFSTPLSTKDIERTIWEDRPCMITLLPSYIKSLSLIAVILAIYITLTIYTPEYIKYHKYGIFVFSTILMLFIIFMLYQYFDLKSTKWELTTERFNYSEGLLNKTSENMELYRIKDFKLKSPLIYRIFGYGYVSIIASDKTTSNISIGIIKKPKNFFELLRKYTERQRTRHGVREIEIS